jgi:ABC-2 type transport system permease protein
MDPASYWAALVIDSTLFLTQAAVFAFIYSGVDAVNGWTAWHCVFFVGTFTLIDGLYMASYFFGLIGLPDLAASGELDLYLAKPLPPLLHVAFRSVDPGSLFIALPAVGLLAASAAALGLPVTPGAVAAYLAAALLMLVLVFDLMVLIRLPCFWFQRLTALQTVEGALVESSIRVPGPLWRGALRWLFNVFLPYGLIATFPSEVFFGQAGAGRWLGAAAVVAAFTVLTGIGWRAALRRYAGAGA